MANTQESYPTEITNQQMASLVAYVSAQEKSGKIASFYTNIIREWLNSIPTACPQPFMQEEIQPTSSNVDTIICKGLVRVRFGWSETHIGCHTVSLQNIYSEVTKELQPDEIVSLKEAFIQELLGLLLRTTGSKSHILISDNYNNTVRNGAAYLFNLLDKKSSVWGNKSGVWERRTTFFSTLDVIELLQVKCAENEKVYGKIIVTPFTTNANYGKGSCRTCVWMPPRAFDDYEADIVTVHPSMLQAWEAYNVAHPLKPKVDLTKKTPVKKAIKKALKPPATPAQVDQVVQDVKAMHEIFNKVNPVVPGLFVGDARVSQEVLQYGDYVQT